MSDFFDRDYYENGIATGKSCYENYRWIPELTYPLAHSVCEHLGIQRGDAVLDYGCAHGFMVRSLRDFGVNAYGCDISSFAISQCQREVEPFLGLVTGSLADLVESRKWPHFNWIVAKDVFEHIDEEPLTRIVRDCAQLASHIFVVVPLGENEAYRIQCYEDDPSHVIRKNEDWWCNLLRENGFGEVSCVNHVPGIKERWFDVNRNGNGFFIGKSNV